MQVAEPENELTRRTISAHKIGHVLDFLRRRPVAVQRVGRELVVARVNRVERRPEIDVYTFGDIARWFDAAARHMSSHGCSLHDGLIAEWPTSRIVRRRLSSAQRSEENPEQESGCGDAEAT